MCNKLYDCTDLEFKVQQGEWLTKFKQQIYQVYKLIIYQVYKLIIYQWIDTINK